MDVHRGADRPLSAAAAALELESVRLSFGGLVALDGASLVLRPRTVHALLGENGAGKTTLMRVAFGLLRPAGGVIRVGGRAVHFSSPADAIAEQIGMVHQHFTLVAAMTVAENVALGGHGRFDPRRACDRVREIGHTTGLVLDPEARVSALSVGGQQRLEIVKALARDARILILDEPTAVLAPSDAAELLAWLHRFADAGGAAVVITHKLHEAVTAADDITVLHRGRTVLTMAAAEATENELAVAMVGEAEPSPGPVSRRSAGPAATTAAAAGSAAEPGRREAATAAPVVARARGLGIADASGVLRIRDATFDLHGGEVVGIAAIEGAGQHELLRTLAGRLPAAAGAVELPAEIGFVPEDRHQDGAILGFTLTENVALRGAGARRGLVGWRRVAAHTGSLIRAFDIRAESPAAPLRSLSGGNQQKLVLARELDGDPPLLIAENPARGLDIRATAAIHTRLRRARDRGAAVVVYSSDLDEVLALATRILVIFAGTVRDVAPVRDAVARAMLGASELRGTDS